MFHSFLSFVFGLTGHDFRSDSPFLNEIFKTPSFNNWCNDLLTLLNADYVRDSQVGWDDVKILAMETVGADSLYQSVKQGNIVTLPSITSIAKTLGAKVIKILYIKKNTKKTK